MTTDRNSANVTPILSTIENSFQPDPGRVQLGYSMYVGKFAYFFIRFYYTNFLVNTESFKGAFTNYVYKKR